MSRKDVKRAEAIMEALQFGLAAQFVGIVKINLRRLSCADLNSLYLLAIANDDDEEISVLLPLIEAEVDLRRPFDPKVWDRVERRIASRAAIVERGLPPVELPF